MKSDLSVRKELVRVGRFLRDHGYIVASDGNLSARLNRNGFLITPAGRDKGALTPGSLVRVKIGKETSVSKTASTELFFHSAIYANRPDTGAVVHAHPPFLTGFALAKFDLSKPLLPEIVVTVGKIGLVEYRKPGSKELARMVGEAITDHNALILTNHGAITVGKDLTEALWRLERCELLARAVAIARLLSGEEPLSDK